MIDQDRIRRATLEILLAIGEDPTREGLRDTPARVARFYDEFFNWDSGRLGTTFEEIKVNEMIIARNIEGYSFCEHHILPFRFTAHVGYLPLKVRPGVEWRALNRLCSHIGLRPNKVLGYSKIIRVVQKHAHKLQLQERMAYEIANEIKALSGAIGVGVLIEGEHLCAIMRGVRAQGSTLVTSALLGVFHEDKVKSEFLRLCGK